MAEEKSTKTLDLVTIGEALVDMISTSPGKTMEESTGYVRAFGGAMANVAVGSARLGGKTGFIGKLGDDPFGRFLKNTMQEAGIIPDGIVMTTRYQTSVVFVSLEEDGKPTFYFYGQPAADLQLTTEEVNYGIVKSTRFFHYGTVSLSAEPARSATMAAVKAALDEGAIVSYDPNLRFHMWSDSEAAVKWALKMMPLADIVKLNDEEARWLVGTDVPKEAAEKLLDMGPRLVVVTMGDRGAYYASESSEGQIPAFEVKVVDTTGAGDAFVAAFLNGLAMGGLEDPLEDENAVRNALVRATAAAGLTTESVGAVSAMPTADDLEKALNERFQADSD